MVSKEKQCENLPTGHCEEAGEECIRQWEGSTYENSKALQ